MAEKSNTLHELGWKHFFQQQLSLEELATVTPVRVFALNRHLVDEIVRKFVVPTAGLCRLHCKAHLCPRMKYLAAPQTVLIKSAAV